MMKGNGKAPINTFTTLCNVFGEKRFYKGYRINNLFKEYFHTIITRIQNHVFTTIIFMRVFQKKKFFCQYTKRIYNFQ